jgi:predicted alpha-1,6-mannanase (GH76 family)
MTARLQSYATAAVQALQEWYGADPYAARTGLYHWDDVAAATSELNVPSLVIDVIRAIGKLHDVEDTLRWWNSANAITALIDYMIITNDTTYLSVVENTFANAPTAYTINKSNLVKVIEDAAIAGGIVGGVFSGGLGAAAAAFAAAVAAALPAYNSSVILYTNFLDAFYDDEGWWALAWIRAYDLTGDQKYLNQAETILGDMMSGWDATCSGGTYWAKDHKGPNGQSPYKNAIANELYLAVSAGLALRLQKANPSQPPPQVEIYTQLAMQEWRWFSTIGLINSANLINDGLDTSCLNDLSQPVYSYNQGVILGGLCDLSELTRDQTFISAAENIADAFIQNPVYTPKQEWIGNNTTASAPFVPGDGFVYFQGLHDNKLWKIATDGSNQQQLGTNTTASRPFAAADGFIYFQGTNDNKLWKIDKSGNNLQSLNNNTTGAAPFVPGDGYVYFQGLHDNKLWKTATDGSNQQQLGTNTTASTPFVAADGFVYFQGTNDNKLWKVDKSGNNLQSLNNNTTASAPFVPGDGFVYFQGLHDNKLWKISTNGATQQQVGTNTTASTPFVTPDSWVYFQGVHDNKLWKVFNDGTKQVQLNNNTTASTPSVPGDGWCYFQGTDNRLWRVQTDGTPESGIDQNGILTELSDVGGNPGIDECQFKGIFMRNLGYLYARTRRPRYRAFILANANSAIKTMNSANQFGAQWDVSPPDDKTDFVRQTSGIDLLNAAMRTQTDLSYLVPLLLT